MCQLGANRNSERAGYRGPSTPPIPKPGRGSKSPTFEVAAKGGGGGGGGGGEHV